MRDRVRKWGRKYPLFDAIDIAVSDNGFKLMCLLYLTPVLPLSIVSYLLGTTSMQLYKFAAAKIAAVPLMLMYVFIGASTDMLISGETDAEAANDNAKSSKKISVDDETHRKMVLMGICLSVVSMSLVSHFVKKELNKVRSLRDSTSILLLSLTCKMHHGQRSLSNKNMTRTCAKKYQAKVCRKQVTWKW